VALHECISVGSHRKSSGMGSSEAKAASPGLAVCHDVNRSSTGLSIDIHFVSLKMAKNLADPKLRGKIQTTPVLEVI
jgi:hypothetical protein